MMSHDTDANSEVIASRFSADADRLDAHWDALVSGMPDSRRDLDPALARVVRDLHAHDDAPFAADLWRQLAREPAPPEPAPRRERTAARWRGRAVVLPASLTPASDVWPRRPRHRRIPRIAALLAALALLLGGIGAYLQLWAPVPASAAQVILQRAAARLWTASNGVSHGVYTIKGSVPRTLDIGGTSVTTATLDVWVRLGAGGAVAQQAISLYGPEHALLSRTIEAGGAATTYNPLLNEIVRGTVGAYQYPDPFVTSLQTYLTSLRQGSAGNARLLPARRLNGVAVDVVEVTVSGTTTTLYVDAATYLLRGMDFQSVDQAGAVQSASMLRTVRYQTMALSSAPPHTFVLGAPPTARVVGPQTAQSRVEYLHSVAQALVLAGPPSLLLARDAAGLRLWLLLRTVSPAGVSRVAFMYRAGSPPHQQGFVVQMMRVLPGSSVTSIGLPGIDSSARPITVTIAGHAIRAMYEVYGAQKNLPRGLGASSTRFLSYKQGATTIMLEGQSLSRRAFFGAVAALVDGRAQPGLIARLQHELDAPPPQWGLTTRR